MLTTQEDTDYRESFNLWLRIGRWLISPEVKKGNPYHDPTNGEFTFGPGGPGAGRLRVGETAPNAKPAEQPRPASTGAKPVPPRQALAEKPKKASPLNIANGTNRNPSQIAAESIASTTIQARLAWPGVTADARYELQRFLDGTPSDTVSKTYVLTSAGSKEVRDSDYGKELDAHVQAMIAKRNGGKIPNGDYVELQPEEDDRLKNPNRFETFRSAGLKEFFKPFGEKVTLVDVIGSFTQPLKVHVRNGLVTYTGINVTTLRSFAAANALSGRGIELGLVDPEPDSGLLGKINQTVIFQFPKRH
jgi:hypothetical protein